jgi:hypothetical protein
MIMPDPILVQQQTAYNLKLSLPPYSPDLALSDFWLQLQKNISKASLHV